MREPFSPEMLRDVMCLILETLDVFKRKGRLESLFYTLKTLLSLLVVYSLVRTSKV